MLLLLLVLFLAGRPILTTFLGRWLFVVIATTRAAFLTGLLLLFLAIVLLRRGRQTGRGTLAVRRYLLLVLLVVFFHLATFLFEISLDLLERLFFLLVDLDQVLDIFSATEREGWCVCEEEEEDAGYGTSCNQRTTRGYGIWI